MIRHVETNLKAARTLLVYSCWDTFIETTALGALKMECLKPMFFHEPIEVSTMLPNTSHKHWPQLPGIQLRTVVQDADKLLFSKPDWLWIHFSRCWDYTPPVNEKEPTVFLLTPPHPVFLTLPPRSRSDRLSGRCHVAGDVTFLRPPLFRGAFSGGGVWPGFFWEEKMGECRFWGVEMLKCWKHNSDTEIVRVWKTCGFYFGEVLCHF